jgi:C-terminal processing protease CtpA/Prc
MKSFILSVVFFVFWINLTSQHKISENQLHTLEDFSKIYGIARFFHPSDECSNMDWESFSLINIEKILKMKESESNNDSFLISIFRSIIPSLDFDTAYYSNFRKNKYRKIWKHSGYGKQGSKTYKSERIFKEIIDESYTPNFQEIRLNSGRILKIPLGVYYDSNLRTIPIGSTAFYEENLGHRNIDKNTYKNSIAIYNFIHTYNVLRHFFPYQNELKLNWDELLNTYLNQSVNDTTKIQHSNTLKRFLNHFKDGHMGVYCADIIENFAIPVSFEMIDLELYVKKIKDTTLNIKLGEKVLRINNMSSRKYIDSIRNLVLGSDQRQNYLISLQLSKGTQNDSIEIEFENNKKIEFKYTLDFFKQKWFYQREDTIAMRKIDDNICYINLSFCSSDTILKKMDSLRLYKAIIFDLRGYPLDGFSKILPYLGVYNDTNWLVRFDYIQPYFKGYKIIEKSWNLAPVPNPLNNIHIMLIDGRSISYAESVAGLFKFYGDKNYVIGSPSSGANGNVNSVKLLSGFSFSFTGLKVVNLDGSQHFINGVEPDIVVKRKPVYIKNGRDIFMEEAIHFIKSKLKK